MPTTCELIAKVTLGSDASAITFSDIPAAHTDLLLLASLRTTRPTVATDGALISLNSSTSNFSTRRLYGNGSSVGSDTYTARRIGVVPASGATSSTFGSLELYVPNYAGGANKSMSSSAVRESNTTEANIEIHAGLWADTAAIASLSLSPENTTNWLSGSSAYL